MKVTSEKFIHELITGFKPLQVFGRHAIFVKSDLPVLFVIIETEKKSQQYFNISAIKQKSICFKSTRYSGHYSVSII